MSPARDDRAIPADRQHRPWPSRRNIDVPGLEEPAYCMAAILSDGEYGHRSVLVLASEDGTPVTSEQLGQLADRLESLYGQEAPEGSRAWLRAKVAQWTEAAEKINARHVDALQKLGDALRERDELAASLAEARATWGELTAAVEKDGPIPHNRVGDALHNWRGRAEVAERALQAAREQLHEVRTAVISQRDGALTDALDQVSRLQQELKYARRDAAEASEDASRYANALTTLEQQRDQARREVEQLADKLQHSIDARASLLALWKADIRRSIDTQAALTRAVRRRGRLAAAGALTTAASALAWRFRR